MLDLAVKITVVKSRCEKNGYLSCREKLQLLNHAVINISELTPNGEIVIRIVIIRYKTDQISDSPKNLNSIYFDDKRSLGTVEGLLEAILD